MADRRYKLIGQGLVGNCEFKQADLSDGDGISWSQTLQKWTAGPVGILPGDDVTWTGDHVFVNQVEFQSGMLLPNQVWLQGEDTGGTPQDLIACNNSNQCIVGDLSLDTVIRGDAIELRHQGTPKLITETTGVQVDNQVDILQNSELAYLTMGRGSGTNTNDVAWFLQAFSAGSQGTFKLLKTEADGANPEERLVIPENSPEMILRSPGFTTLTVQSNDGNGYAIYGYRSNTTYQKYYTAYNPTGDGAWFLAQFNESTGAFESVRQVHQTDGDWEIKDELNVLTLRVDQLGDTYVQRDLDVDRNANIGFDMTIGDDLFVEGFTRMENGAALWNADTLDFYNGAGTSPGTSISPTYVEIGTPATSNFAFVDFHTSGFSNDFDARILCDSGSGTNGTAGEGDLQYTALNHRFYAGGNYRFEIGYDGVSGYYFSQSRAGYFAATAPASNIISAGFIAGSTTATHTNTEWYDSAVTLKAQCRVDGNFYNANGTYGTLSDGRRKRAVVDEDHGRETIKALRPVNFIYNHDEKNERRSGFIAQEVRTVLPEAVEFHEAVPERSIAGRTAPAIEEHYTINMQALIPALVNAVKELDAEVDALRAEIREIRNGTNAPANRQQGSSETPRGRG